MEYDELRYFIELNVKHGINGNSLKDKIQNYAIDKWLRKPVNGIGCLEAFTGFGKTYLLTKVFKRYRTRFNDNIIVIVPNTNLYEDFIKIGKDLQLENYYVYVLNTYTMSDTVKECGLLIIDELHRVCNEMSDYFKEAIPLTKYNRLLGVSATLNKNHKEFLEQFGIESFFNITLEEGTRLNIVPEYEVINVGVELTQLEKKEFYENQKLFKSYFKWFMIDGYNAFELMMACSVANGVNMKVTVSDDFGKSILIKPSETWASIVANYHNDPKITFKHIKTKAVMAKTAMTNREKIINNSVNKLNFLEKALNQLDEINENKNENFIYSISFLNSLEQISQISNNKSSLGYHSKLTNKQKENTLSNFKIGVFKNLLTIKALDEGYDNKKVSVGFNLSYHSNIVTTIQRMGRILRLDSNNPDKKGIFIFVYCLPFIIEDEGIIEVLPNDYKKLEKLQKNMLNVSFKSQKECLERLRRL